MTFLNKSALAAAAALVLGLAVVPARAGEVQGQLTFFCHKKRYAYGPACYNPCPPVGPVRRFLRRIFRPCCPPPAVAVAVPAVPACPPPPPPVMSAPVVGVPAAPPVGIERPVPGPPVGPPPAAPFPGTGSSLRRNGVLTPPAAEPPVPVRYDRIASRADERPVVRGKGQTAAPVVLVSVERSDLRKRAEADERGLLTVDLAAGGWRIYGWDESGKPVLHGRIDVRQAGPVRVQLRQDGR